MNKNEFIKVLLPTAEYYSKVLTDGLIEVYYHQAKDLDFELFGLLVKNHIADSDQGRFWPTFAHLTAQAGNEKDIATQAGIDFDKNPKIDGTCSFDIRNENTIKTASRRKNWIEREVLEWKKTTPIERLTNSPLIGFDTLKLGVD